MDFDVSRKCGDNVKVGLRRDWEVIDLLNSEGL